MRPRSPRVARIALAAPAACVAGLLSAAACFDFDATMAGGPLSDSGPPVGSDGSFADAHVGGGDGGGGGTDAGANDASDAATPPVDASRYCASFGPDAGLVLCDDFDDAGALPGPFNVLGEQSGTLTLTTAQARSAPSSLDEKTFPLDDGGAINVALRANPIPLPAVPSTLKLAFSVFPVQIDSASGAAIVLGAVDFLDAANDRYSVGLAINVALGAPALALDEQSGFADGGTAITAHPLLATQPLTMSAWNDVVVEIDWTSATGATGIVTVNGAEELDVPLTLTVQPTFLQVGIGTAYVSQPSPGWELLYDNVSFTD